MLRNFKFLGSLVLLGAFSMPVATLARPMVQDEHHDQDRDHDRDHRYYDKAHKDYHQWNEHEDAAYRRWLAERHRDYRDFGRLSAKDQQRYWTWRHEHPDER